MSDINTTPLVDVMLVLLIIFLITVPVVIQTVPIKLPKVRYEPTDDQAGERLADRAQRRRAARARSIGTCSRSTARSCSTAR